MIRTGYAISIYSVLSVLVGSLFCMNITLAQSQTRQVWEDAYEGLVIRVYAPYQAYPGDTISVRVRIEATESLNGLYIDLVISGSRSAGYGKYGHSIDVLSNVSLASSGVRDADYDVNLPSDLDQGMLVSCVNGWWKIYRGELTGWVAHGTERWTFDLTYLMSKSYDDLQSKYSSLQAQLNSALNQMYLFVLTTIIFIAATIFFAVRRSRMRPTKDALNIEDSSQNR